VEKDSGKMVLLKTTLNVKLVKPHVVNVIHTELINVPIVVKRMVYTDSCKQPVVSKNVVDLIMETKLIILVMIVTLLVKLVLELLNMIVLNVLKDYTNKPKTVNKSVKTHVHSDNMNMMPLEPVKNVP